MAVSGVLKGDIGIMDHGLLRDSMHSVRRWMDFISAPRFPHRLPSRRLSGTKAGTGKNAGHEYCCHHVSVLHRHRPSGCIRARPGDAAPGRERRSAFISALAVNNRLVARDSRRPEAVDLIGTSFSKRRKPFFRSLAALALVNVRAWFTPTNARHPQAKSSRYSTASHPDRPQQALSP